MGIHAAVPVQRAQRGVWVKRLIPVPVAAFVVAHPVLSVFAVLGASCIGILGLCVYDTVGQRTRPVGVPDEMEPDEHEVRIA